MLHSYTYHKEATVKDIFLTFLEKLYFSTALSFKRENLYLFATIGPLALLLSLVPIFTLPSIRFYPWGIVKEKLTKSNLHSGSF